MLSRSPGLTIAAVASLAIGIGANSAIFSVVNAVLLRNIGFRDPNRLMLLWTQNVKSHIDEFAVSAPDYLDWRAQNRTFDDIGLMTFDQANATGLGVPQRVRGGRVSANLLRVLGVEPQLGGIFADGDDRNRDARIVIVSHAFWQRALGGDKEAVGKQLTLDGEQHTIIGVVPDSELYPADIWRPLVLEPHTADSRGSHGYIVVGRLKPGMTIERAGGDMNVIAARLAAQYPDQDGGNGIKVEPIQDHLVRNVRPALLVLFAAVAFVLLIACANVANLLLSRSAGRTREISIRRALGASRWRIARQLLAESVVLSSLAGVFGIVMTTWGLSALLALIPRSVHLPNAAGISLDGRVLAFTLGISVVTGLLFGLAPAIQASKTDVNESLKGSRGASSGAGTRLRSGLVVVEIALSLVLLVGGGLLMKSFANLQNADPGFRAGGVLTMKLSLPVGGYQKPAQQINLYRELIQRVNAAPGVKQAALISDLPLRGSHSEYDSFAIAGRPLSRRAEDLPIADRRWLTPEYFAVMGIPLVRGRYLQDYDNEHSAPVAIIDEAVAAQYWPNEDPVGKRLAYFENSGELQPWRTVVGIVQSVKQVGLDQKASGTVYIPVAQEASPNMVLVTKTVAEPYSVAATVSEAIREVDRNLPVSDIRAMSDFVKDNIWRPRFAGQLIGVFAVLALGLAMLGTYSVIAYAVTQRTRELGIRAALGANRDDILRLVMRQTIFLGLFGVALGVSASFGLTRWLGSLLYDVGTGDSTVLVGASALLITAALTASFIPALRASRVDPLIALRYD